jgi:S1-C subfamily serine protease
MYTPILWLAFCGKMPQNVMLPHRDAVVCLASFHMEKIVISAAEVAETHAPAEQPAQLEPKLPPAVPQWARWALAPLVLFLPLLCLVAFVVRVATRGLPPRTRFEWTSLLATLLIVSGMLTSIATVLAFSFSPMPSVAGTGLSELDEQSSFPNLPAAAPMSAKEVSEKLKPLVAVISPSRRSWFTHAEMPSASFGAGALLQANADGYLFVTARHVLDGPGWNAAKSGSRALVAMASGTWGQADVVARHKSLDLLLLWVPRERGSATFVQPIPKATPPSEGENVFVIGHPEGLRFTLSTGIISRLHGSTIQMSAPVSPGNSGGPVFDDRGNLLGIVTSMVDKNGDPNAENLNFAVRTDALLEDSGWDFASFGRRRFSDYVTHDEALEKTVPATGQQ